MPCTSFGDRLREARKRAGLTQRELAAAARVSLSLVAKLEQGAQPDTRLETARQLAAALGISTSSLLAAERQPAQTTDPSAPWSPVRAAILHSADNAVEDEPPTLAGVSGALNAVARRLVAEDLAAAAHALPRLLRDAAVLGGPMQASVLMLTGRLMIQTRQYDAAEAALDRAERAGWVQGPMEAADLVESRCWLLLRRGRLGDARALATRWVDELEPRMSRATADDLRSWGVVLGRVAAAASRDARQDEAEHALRMASAAGALLTAEAPQGGGSQTSGRARTWSPLTVKMQRVEVAVVSGRPDVALEVAREVNGQRLAPTFGHRNRHLLDVADAQVRTRRYGEAMETLLDVHRAAPQWLPQQQYARDILDKMVRRRRRLTPQMREMARVIALPL
ncbi:helix-turn-helix domain-containing protein [Streptomyces alkaliterrae]|uniref:Helix-turn-helix domain-containing protein n=1 Tax=Streptomyces alkaliterrae TaxID=2213162 RepID=A0A5P0YWJ7_9ACTN|nr:helix-turn-helix transcriptional regulator [Streptomyces alkaliterrae]MBB1253112.1 helix-turn-helix transcriptional regulator [Streptomyces alkaliterrae]MBB1259092.1 helix-turn-helix transcriptional regulator [Streptomyces alkaliterrae]MQS04654.1 helix-turn-helix domain-containing protein [Streptomyces alkaliterrae]